MTPAQMWECLVADYEARLAFDESLRREAAVRLFEGMEDSDIREAFARELGQI